MVQISSGRVFLLPTVNQLRVAVYNRDVLGKTTIIDRTWPSEAIYGPRYRGKSLLTRRQVRRLERFADDNDLIRIAKSAPDVIRRSRIELRGERWDTNQPAITVAYAEYFQTHSAWELR